MKDGMKSGERGGGWERSNSPTIRPDCRFVITVKAAASEGKRER